MAGTIYTEVCPYCGEEYLVEYRPEKDDFVKISCCGCDKLNQTISDVLSAIRELKREYELNPKKFSKKELVNFIDKLQSKLEQVL